MASEKNKYASHEELIGIFMRRVFVSKVISNRELCQRLCQGRIYIKEEAIPAISLLLQIRWGKLGQDAVVVKLIEFRGERCSQ